MSQTHSSGSYEELQFTVRDRMRKAMEFADLDNAQLAQRLGVHKNTVSNHLKNKKKPPPRPLLVAWSWATGAPLEWLESGQVPGDAPDPDDDGHPQPAVSASLESLTEAKRRRAQGRVSTRRYQAAA